MSNDMEQIEARLAAYVDGVLPPEQKAEIEAYLAANPGHGRLLTELRSIKAAVAGLPREKAPAEVMDGVQAHLERYQLLDGVEDHTAPMRINRWPQLGAVAAVLLLMAGLGLLVYQVLPRQRHTDPGLALLPASTQAGEEDGVVLLDEPATQPTAPLIPDFTRPPAGGGPTSALRQADGAAASAARAPAPANAADRFAIGGASMQPARAEAAKSEQAADANEAVLAPPAENAGAEPADRDAAALRLDDPVVRIDVADPVLARNLVAASFARGGRVLLAGPTTAPTTAPATAATDGEATRTILNALLAGDSPRDTFLLVRDVTDAERAGAVRSATGGAAQASAQAAPPAPAAKPSLGTTAPTSTPAGETAGYAKAAAGPGRRVLFLFHAASPATAPASAPATAPAGLR